MRLTMGDNQNFIFNRPFKDAISMKLFSKKETLQMAANKLGELEDIEDELGIELVTLIKALANGMYTSDSNLLTYPCLSVKGKLLITVPSFRTFELKDYGKTWALTKEELQ